MSYRNHPVSDYRSVLTTDTQLVDVRRPDEVADGTFDGAVNIPLEQLVDRIGELDPTRPTVVLCRSGNRSAQAAGFLVASGFRDVVNLEGGMLAYDKEHSS